MNTSYPAKAKTYFANRTTRQLRGWSSERINTLGWSCDGRYLAAGGHDKPIRIWLPQQQNQSSRDAISLNGHTGNIETLSWHPNNAEQLASGSTDKTVKLWDVRSAQSTHTVTADSVLINLAWSPNGDYIAYITADDFLHVADVRMMNKKGQSPIVCSQGHMGMLYHVAWHPEGTQLLCCNGAGVVLVHPWQPAQAGRPAKLEKPGAIVAHTQPCIGIVFDRKKRYMATSGSDTIVCLWDVNEMACVRTLTRIEYPARWLSFSFDGMLLAYSSTDDSSLDVAYVDSGESIFRVRTGGAGGLAWHPNRHLLAYGCDEKGKSERNVAVCVYGYGNT